MSFTVGLKEAGWLVPVKYFVLKGHLDTATVATFEGLVESELGSEPYRWVLDFSSLEYISSAGLAVLAGLRYKIEDHKGHMGFVAMTDKVQRVFKMLGMSDLFAIYPDESAARAAFEKL